MGFKEDLDNTPYGNVSALPVLHGLQHITTPCKNATINEAETIWPILEASLDTSKGYGLAANQIGIGKKVAFVKIGDQVFRLLNTELLNGQGSEVMYNEGCLSLPGKRVHTERYSSISIKDDVLGRVALDVSTDGLLCTIIQHEIDHFNGVTILDRKRRPIKRESPKISRNSPCPCGSGKKYKKCCIS